MKTYVFLGAMLCCAVAWSQPTQADTTKTNSLSEVILIGSKTKVYQKQDKPLMSIDEYLDQSGRIDMIRRGNYALEPTINGMGTERTVITIDGMRIFGACTDKMDPVTSYVEVSNLSEAHVVSGAQGNCHGSAIGGAIDLRRNRGALSNRGWSADLNTGFESNASQKILGAAAHYRGKSFYSDTDFMFRDAGNYAAGDRQNVAHSQFSKLNLSATSGILVAKDKIVEASVIYDKATDVGYPALPMDVSLAQALILSAKMDWRPKDSKTDAWETKLYYNTIVHTMDDTHRESVVHMDMPGWSKTAGYYSKWSGTVHGHKLVADANGFYNMSLAEMTMYPENPDEPPMFMQTWPDVHTAYTGVFLEDTYRFNTRFALTVSTTLAYHKNTICSDMGLQSLRIFYPGTEANQDRFLKNLAVRLSFARDGLDLQAGAALAERAPSVSEGYGFYLFNSFDGFDYIGNPALRNEKSVEFNFTGGYRKNGAVVKLNGAVFHINQYIIAKPDASLIPMTLGANGVKVTTAIHHAFLAHLGLEARFRMSATLEISLAGNYSYGRDDLGEPLPLISPFRYEAGLAFKQRRFTARLGIEGQTRQIRYNASFGEDPTPPYAILKLSGGHTFGEGQCRYQLRCGVDNLLDAYYSTFSDWNNVPRPGRNAFVNFIVSYL